MSEYTEKAEKYVSRLLATELDPKVRYHNLRHTERVVKSTKEILDSGTVNGADPEVMELAAWFHDTGYIHGCEDHEEKSCEIAEEFLSKEGYDAAKLAKVKDIILGTKRYHEPDSIEQEIIRDADASHFGQKSYGETTEFLREELKLLGIKSYSQNEWLNTNIDVFRTEHRYYTDYAQEHWGPRKEKNLNRLVKEKRADKAMAKKEKLKVKYKNESPDRGIQTLYRVTLKNHLTLSDIADTKANILLSVNAIILSVVLSNLIPKLDNPSNFYLIYPASIFILFTTVSMILAVFATRPNVTSGKFTIEDVKNKKVNLLFFGNFHKMKLDEYEWAIEELIRDKDYVYRSLTKDLYFLGLVLNRKYNILRLTYTIFIIGIVVSILAFGISFWFFGGQNRMEEIGMALGL
ncbi:MAG: HD domain-containing protein [Eudoraea sp.]|nr:HD domain-containing protein [Eudoraea sp.]